VTCPNCGHDEHDGRTCLVGEVCEDCSCEGAQAMHLCACTWPDPSNADETPDPLTHVLGNETAESSREIPAAEFRHVDHPYRDDLVVHVPCGAVNTLARVPEHRCNPEQVALMTRIRNGEQPTDVQVTTEQEPPTAASGPAQEADR
jgi:hypothetical protein